MKIRKDLVGLIVCRKVGNACHLNIRIPKSMGFKTKKTAFLVEMQFYQKNMTDNYIFSSSNPVAVRPGPNAMATTLVPDLMAESFMISSRTCGIVAEDMLP